MDNKNTLKKYELVIISKVLLPDCVRRDLMEKVKDAIAKKGGKILNKEIWGKKYLAYPIKRQKEGYYVIYEVELPPNSISVLNNDLKLFPEILRHMFLSNKSKK